MQHKGKHMLTRIRPSAIAQWGQPFTNQLDNLSLNLHGKRGEPNLQVIPQLLNMHVTCVQPPPSQTTYMSIKQERTRNSCVLIQNKLQDSIVSSKVNIRDSSVDKVLVIQAWRPELNLQTLYETCRCGGTCSYQDQSRRGRRIPGACWLTTTHRDQ